MHDPNPAVLRSRIALLESELLIVKQQLSSVEKIAVVSNAAPTVQPSQQSAGAIPVSAAGIGWTWPLEAEEYIRYGRQMIMPEVGLQGQLNLKKASVLIIGVGGLGCPAAQYLAGAGVGTIGLVDGDVVEWSNLHRQILHTTERVGQLKVDSAIAALRQLNPNVCYIAHPAHLSPQNALKVLERYDLVLDCTDHPASRYLISDAAVLLGKILVSGSALRTEGQLMVLNSPPSDPESDYGGPCYRCVFPKPPPVDSVVNCGEGGILGPVVGVIGVLMALEAIKLIFGGASHNEDHQPRTQDVPAAMLLFSAYSKPAFRHVRLRGKRPTCCTCSSRQTISRESLTSGSLDYETFCGIASPINVLEPAERIEARELKEALDAHEKAHIILDVRDETQFALCSLPGSINIPYTTIEDLSDHRITDHKIHPQPASESELATSHDRTILDRLPENLPIYTICRFGNDSQLTVRKLKELGYGKNGTRWIGDVKGGYKAWKQQVDHHWPEY